MGGACQGQGHIAAEDPHSTVAHIAAWGGCCNFNSPPELSKLLQGLLQHQKQPKIGRAPEWLKAMLAPHHWAVSFVLHFLEDSTDSHPMHLNTD